VRRDCTDLKGNEKQKKESLFTSFEDPKTRPTTLGRTILAEKRLILAIINTRERSEPIWLKQRILTYVYSNGYIGVYHLGI
jgi:hypothetical protein